MSMHTDSGTYFNEQYCNCAHVLRCSKLKRKKRESVKDVNLNNDIMGKYNYVVQARQIRFQIAVDYNELIGKKK